MSYVYDVRLSNGQNYAVTTDKHHDNHDDASFQRHLLDVIVSTAGRILGNVIIHEYKLRRPMPR